jgi:hypothetical protein
VFEAPTTYAVYAAVIVGDWAWSVVSTCLMRRIKDIPKPQLARDVACIVLCYSCPMFAAAAAEVSKQVSPSSRLEEIGGPRRRLEQSTAARAITSWRV